MTYQTYEFTAFSEADLLQDGDHNLNCGDSFTMPASATTCISVTDNDSSLSGDNWHNENANDHTGQHASIMGPDGELGNGGQIYAESYFWVCDDAGNWYVMIEIEQEGSNDDYFAFYTGHGYEVPAAGTNLYVYSKCNVKESWVNYNCLDSGEKVEKDPWSFDEETCTYTVEAECWDLHNFKVVDGAQASGGELVKIAAKDGKISTDFGGETGVYNMTICAQDETDGVSKLMVYVNGEFQQTIKLEGQETTGGSNNHGFSGFTLLGLEISEGDTVEIRAWKDNCEFVRIDAIKFEQVKFEECDLKGAIKLDFEGFAAGDVLTDQLDGITITAMGGSNDAMIFDSQNPTGGDGDLETQAAQLGNVLIVSEDGDSSDPDDVVGGKVSFEFDTPATVFDLKVIDTEEGGTITLTLADGGSVVFDIPELVNGGVGQVLMSVENVVRMDVELDGSGAIDDLCYVPGDANNPPPGSLSGRYFFDANRDGLDNDTDSAIAGIVVELLDENDNPTGESTVTDVNGNYSFDNLEAGTYGVKFTDPDATRELTTQNVDGNASDDVDSDASDVGNGMSTITGIVVLPAQDTPDNDAGVVELFGALSGTYFCDEDRDGVDDGAANGDADVAGKLVTLLNADGTPTGLTTATDAEGNYRFDNLSAGDYKVMFEAEASKSFVAQNTGNDDSIDSDVDANGMTGAVTVLAGEETTDVDVGVETVLGSLSGRYFCDTDGDAQDNNNGDEPGVEGVVVELLDANGNPTGITTTTDDLGFYEFTGLVPGSYGVEFTDPSNVLEGKILVDANVGDDASDSDATGDTTSAKIEGIIVIGGQNTPDNDAGVEELGSLSGRYFCDENRDGLDNDANNAIEGVTVELLDANGNPTGRTTQTDAQGNYSFAGLVAATYGVKFTDASGKILTSQNVGNDDAIDSDAFDQGNGMSIITGIEVVNGEDNSDNDAGVFPNDAPEVSDDAAMFCADDEATVDLSDNYTDADSASVVLTSFGGADVSGLADGDMFFLDGTANEGTADEFDFTGLKVTKNGDSFTFDAEDAFAALDINESASVNISFHATDSDGAVSQDGKVALTIKGDANSVDSLLDSIDVTGSYQLATGLFDNPIGDNGFDLKIEGTGDARFDGVIFEQAYCLSFFDPFEAGSDFATAPSFTADIFGASEAATAGVLNANQVSFATGDPAADNLDLVNWIINQDFENDASGDYNGWEVQFAIWELLDDFDAASVFSNQPQFGQAADTQEIIDLALANGEGFEAGVGDKVGVVVNPNPALPDNSQPFLIAIDFEAYDCIC